LKFNIYQTTTVSGGKARPAIQLRRPPRCEYRRCFSDPKTIHAACEDYRAAASIDLDHDEADMDQKIACPLLVLWGAKGLVGRKYDALSIWRQRAIRVSGKALPGGHWLPEECPNEMLSEIAAFLRFSS
jgi:haloacetate dehalogenase